MTKRTHAVTEEPKPLEDETDSRLHPSGHPMTSLVNPDVGNLKQKEMVSDKIIHR